MSGRVDVTVAVCTWNRAALLAQTLAGFAGQAVPAGLSWELLVVDNNSPDHTQSVLAEHTAAAALPLRTAREPRQGLSHARNRALELARGDWVLWTDDDVLVPPGYLAAFAAAAARHPAAAALGGPIDPWFPEPPDPDLAAAFRPLRTGFCGLNHGPAERELGPGEPLYGANMGFRTAAVAGLRFDPALGRRGGHQGGHEDVEYQARARAAGPVVWVPDLRLKHYVEPARMTRRYARRFCRDMAQVLDPPDLTPRLFGAPRWLYRRYLDHLLAGWVSGLRGRQADRTRALIGRWQASGMIAAYRRQRAAP